MRDVFDSARELVRRGGFTLRQVDSVDGGDARAVVDDHLRILEYGPRATALDLLEALDPHVELPPGWRNLVARAMDHDRPPAVT